MKIAAIICEYNPFHNGHEYHIKKTKEITGADHIIAVMSGNYVQRGTPAIMDKKLRAKSALLCGADLVIELPLFAACGSAPDFAMGAVTLLHKLGIIDYLSFGSECQDINKLKAISSFLIQHESEIEAGTKEFMKLGYSYPKAKESYLLKKLDDPSLIKILKEPNNILGIEYLKALIRLNSMITPICIERIGSDHHNQELLPFISSATSIRSALEVGDIDALLKRVPASLHDLYKEHYMKDFPICTNDFSLLLQSSLASYEDFSQIAGISKDLRDRILKVNRVDLTFEQLVSACKTKNITWSKISRHLLHILLGITNDHLAIARAYQMAPYFQILGFKRNTSFLIGCLKQKSSIPMIRHLRPLHDPLSDEQQHLLSTEQRAHQLYLAVVGQKYHAILKDEQIIV